MCGLCLWRGDLVPWVAGLEEGYAVHDSSLWRGDLVPLAAGLEEGYMGHDYTLAGLEGVHCMYNISALCCVNITATMCCYGCRTS